MIDTGGVVRPVLVGDGMHVPGAVGPAFPEGQSPSVVSQIVGRARLVGGGAGQGWGPAQEGVELGRTADPVVGRI